MRGCHSSDKRAEEAHDKRNYRTDRRSGDQSVPPPRQVCRAETAQGADQHRPGINIHRLRPELRTCAGFQDQITTLGDGLTGIQKALHDGGRRILAEPGRAEDG